jgi:hypothetical protein
MDVNRRHTLYRVTRGERKQQGQVIEEMAALYRIMDLQAVPRTK